MSTAAQVPGSAATAVMAAGIGAAGNQTAGDPPTITIPAGFKVDNTLGVLFIGCSLGMLSVLYPHPFA
jgi:hypothetical protein